MTTERCDDAVVGAGVIGLAVAYHLAVRGRRVVVFERHPRPRGASVRNFGMLWPIGQPAGPLRTLAMRSRSLWLDVLAQAGASHERTGSLHVAYEDDEARVLQEFHAECEHTGFACELLEPSRAREACPLLRPAGLRLALWSPNEVCVDPRIASSALVAWLSRALGVTFKLGVHVSRCELPLIQSGSSAWQAERAWICAGDELRALFPEEFGQLGLVRCKLQMMRSRPLGSRLGPMLAAGLTLAHYTGFRRCPSLAALTHRLAADLPEYQRFGIHVMVSQNGLGELTLGDSHQYGDEIEPFDNSAIDALILEYLDRFLDTTQVKIRSRWHGHYVKHPTEPFALVTPRERTVALMGLGGHGMTLSFGLAEQAVSDALGATDT